MPPSSRPRSKPVLVYGTEGETPQAKVLNVGRTARLATPKQRHAVITRQGGYCATPGCSNTYLEIHHVAWRERDGGRTDLNNPVGICTRCHHLVHQNRLKIEPDSSGGFTFRRSTGKRLHDHRRRNAYRIRQLLRRAFRASP